MQPFLTPAETGAIKERIRLELENLQYGKDGDLVLALVHWSLEGFTINRVIDSATLSPGQGDQREVEALQVLERASRAAPLPGPGARTDGIVVFTCAEIPGRGGASRR